MIRKIVDRIEKQAGVPDLLNTLVNNISLSDLQSLLLEVYRQKAETLTPHQLLTQYEHNRFVRIANENPKTFIDFDRLAYSLLPDDFEPIELSPVCPLGTNSVLAPVDQNNVVTTIRNTEVCADSTNILALECALRRRDVLHNKIRHNKNVKLCASQRLIRAQTFKGVDSFAHFRIFSLCTAGRDTGSYRFEIESVLAHIHFYIRLLRRMDDLKRPVTGIRVAFMIYTESLVEIVKTEIAAVLAKTYPDYKFEVDFDDTPQTYYTGLRYQLHATNTDDDEYFLVDGGFTDWTQKLLSNGKERLLIGGMGSERFLVCFK